MNPACVALGGALAIGRAVGRQSAAFAGTTITGTVAAPKQVGRDAAGQQPEQAAEPAGAADDRVSTGVVSDFGDLPRRP